MMVFLFSSPLLNPIIIGLFVVTFGIKVALFYFLVAIVVAVTAGFVLEKLGFDKDVKPEAYEKAESSSCGKSCGTSKEEAPTSCFSSTPEPASASCCPKNPAMATALCCKVHLKSIKMTIVGCVFGAQLGRISKQVFLTC
jgi:uncharacterized membrane protein YraQ (UPF0718 family)